MKNLIEVKITVILLLIFIIISTQTSAQQDTSWHGKSCAVVLTYDDGLDIDLTHVIPTLDSVALKGTFYISDYANALSKQIDSWRKAAAEGHELANHSIWHPCEGGRVGREFVQDYDLRFYTVKKMDNEIREMNTILTSIDGKTERTFAYPCGDRTIHDSDYIDPLKDEFIAARGVSPSMPAADKVELYNVSCYAMNGQTGAQMIDLVNEAEKNHGLLVFLFHGVGGGHSLNVSLSAHSVLLHYLQRHQNTIWVAPMIDVAKYIKAKQQK